MRAVEVGFNVVGLDNNEYRTSALEKGISFIDDVSGERLQAALASNRYLPTTAYANAAEFDVAVITVPTPLRESLPDLTFIESAARDIAPYIRAGSTVVLESTTYPGTTEELLIPILEKGSSLTAGRDFSVGYSPERIDPGNKTWNFQNTPKVVSGLDASSLRDVSSFYRQLVDTVVPASGLKEAELTKLLENTFRHVNIALVNELAVFAHQLDVDIWDAIDAASSKPFGFMPFLPGPGVGGHCLPVDPSYLSWQVKRELGQHFRFVELANDINEHMPRYVVERVTSMLNSSKLAVNGSRIAILGIAYKRNTGDIREAPSQRIIEILSEMGATLVGVDSHVSSFDWPTRLEKAATLDDALETAHAVILLTDHDDTDLERLMKTRVPVLDTRNVVSGPTIERL